MGAATARKPCGAPVRRGARGRCETPFIPRRMSNLERSLLEEASILLEEASNLLEDVEG
jgi:hypothetical protein